MVRLQQHCKLQKNFSYKLSMWIWMRNYYNQPDEHLPLYLPPTQSQNANATRINSHEHDFASVFCANQNAKTEMKYKNTHRKKNSYFELPQRSTGQAQLMRNSFPLSLVLCKSQPRRRPVPSHQQRRVLLLKRSILSRNSCLIEKTEKHNKKR